jgi:hypothetical protein
MRHHRIAARRRLVPFCLMGLLFVNAATARGQPSGGMMLQSTLDSGDDNIPTGARRAAEWKPSPEGIRGYPWDFSFGAGFAYYSGDDFDDTGLALEVKLARDLSNGFYASAAYLLTFAETEVTDPLDGSTSDEDHVLNIPTLGVGFRAEFNPEINLFIEPRIGAVITSDDAGIAAGASAGVNIQLQPGMSVHVTFTGLATDLAVETDAGDADLNGLFAAGIGLVFEF